MAQANEVWLGWLYPQYHEKAPADAPRMEGWKPEWAAGLPETRQERADFLEVNAEWKFAFDGWVKKTCDRPLLNAWLDAVKAMGWTAKPAKKSLRQGHVVETPAGKWEFSPFSLGAEYGGEMEFFPPDMPIGVPLSSRYYPTFLDYRDPSGALPNPLVVWDRETAKMIEVAARHIVAAVPWLANAPTMVVEIHY